jgi:hypothetical protein
MTYKSDFGIVRNGVRHKFWSNSWMNWHLRLMPSNGWEDAIALCVFAVFLGAIALIAAWYTNALCGEPLTPAGAALAWVFGIMGVLGMFGLVCMRLLSQR